jgi:hypothetical protein
MSAHPERRRGTGSSEAENLGKRVGTSRLRSTQSLVFARDERK